MQQSHKFGLALAAVLAAMPVATFAQNLSEKRLLPVLNPGFELTGEGTAINGWGDPAATGSRVTVDSDNPASGAASLRLDAASDEGAPGSSPGSSVVTQMVNAARYRGRRIRLTAMARVNMPDPAHAGLWLRVDRPFKRAGFFDNMYDRPITGEDWSVFAIEGDVAVDATQIAFGGLIQKNGSLWVDDFVIEDIGPAADLPFENPSQRPGPVRGGPTEGDVPAAAIDARGVANLQAFARLYGLVRWFHPSEQARNVDWGKFLIAHIPAIEEAQDAPALAEALRSAFGPLTSGLVIGTGQSVEPAPLAEKEAYVRWKHRGYATIPDPAYGSELETIAAGDAPPPIVEQLPGGVAFSLPLGLPEGSGETATGWIAETPIAQTGKPKGWMPAGFDRTTRIAGIVSGWAVLDHFYPYWDVVETDWDDVFAPMVQDAALAEDDQAYHTVLSRFVETLQDGHGIVLYRYNSRYILPVNFRWIEGQMVVTYAPSDMTTLEPGMIVRSIDGVPVADALEEEKGLVSGSEHFKTSVATNRLRSGAEQNDILLELETADGHRFEQTVSRIKATADNWDPHTRPGKVADLDNGILYADLTALTDQDLAEAASRFAAAKGLVFDLRGRPRNRPSYLGHLAGENIRSAMFNIGQKTRPDEAIDAYRDVGWTIPPEMPRWTRAVVFLTDARAASYPESVLGTVKGNGLGTVVGGPTAGANGNVAMLTLPGGYTLRWTGMQVINRDGTLHHNIGVLPDIAVEQTIAGIREGRDEVLEAGVAEVKRLMETSGS